MTDENQNNSQAITTPPGYEPQKVVAPGKNVIPILSGLPFNDTFPPIFGMNE